MDHIVAYISLLVINCAIAGIAVWLIGKVKRLPARVAVATCAFFLAAIIASLLLA